MAIVGVATNCLVLVNSVDLSNHCRGATWEDSRAPVEVTAFGSAYVQETKGLGTAAITLTLLWDFAGGSVHATLSPLIGSNTGVPVEVRPINAARSATNPAILLASAVLFTYPGSFTMGEAAEGEFEFRNSSTGTGITYPTA